MTEYAKMTPAQRRMAWGLEMGCALCKQGDTEHVHQLDQHYRLTATIPMAEVTSAYVADL